MRCCLLLPLLTFLIPLATTHAAPRGGAITGNVTLQPSGRPVANAIVYLGGSGVAVNGPRPPVLVDFKQNWLWPRVQVAVSGAPLVLQNSDPALHIVRLEEIRTNSHPRLLRRVAMPYAGFEKRFALPTATEARLLRVVGENGDENRIAWLAVLPHDRAAITTADGQFRIREAPVGQHPIYVWQETLGTLAGRVTVRRGQPATVEFQFPRGWTRAVQRRE